MKARALSDSPPARRSGEKCEKQIPLLCITLKAFVSASYLKR